MKEFNAAIDYYDIALKIDENFPMALAYKGLALGELGEIDNALHFFKAALSIENFINLLSNWYIRRNRRRFWKSG